MEKLQIIIEWDENGFTWNTTANLVVALGYLELVKHKMVNLISPPEKDDHADS